MQAQMLAPAAVLIAWSLVVLFWLGFSRFGAMSKSGKSFKDAPAGVRGQNLDGVLPDQANWKAHNYAHLMEQPTLFYAASLVVALLGAAAGDVLAAWIYVALRIVHSLWQAVVNTLSVRFSLFVASTLALVYLAFRALTLTLFPELVPA